MVPFGHEKRVCLGVDFLDHFDEETTDLLFETNMSSVEQAN